MYIHFQGDGKKKTSDRLKQTVCVDLEASYPRGWICSVALVSRVHVCITKVHPGPEAPSWLDLGVSA